MTTDLEIEVARIIDPVAMGKYDKAVTERRVAANGKPWADVAYGRGRDDAIKQARAAITAVRNAI